MQALLGFELDIWDYLTFLTLAACVVALIMTWLFLAGLPGRIAIARKHPEAEAVKYLGYAGLLPTVYPWMQALIWAFKPTDKVDIRRLPREEAIEEDRELARLRGLPASLKAAIKDSSAVAEAERPTEPAEPAGAGAEGAKP